MEPMRRFSPTFLASFLVAAGLATADGIAQTVSPVVKIIEGYSVAYPAGKIGGSSAEGLPAHYVAIPPAKEYWLDYQVYFENDFQWVKGGKLPGLVGGTHTSGCAAIQANGWSARFMWHENGGGHFYYYHQNRASGCGDVRNFSNGLSFKKNAWNRITERVVVNTVGQSNGLAQAWLNGQKILDLGGIRWRGNVGETVALVDNVSLQTFYGGSSNDWAPSTTTHARFSNYIVRTDSPDLTKPFDPNPLSTGIRRDAGVRALILAEVPAHARLTDLRGRSVPRLSLQSSSSPTSIASPLFTVTASSTGSIFNPLLSGR
jgi:hypothetical protein